MEVKLVKAAFIFIFVFCLGGLSQGQSVDATPAPSPSPLLIPAATPIPQPTPDTAVVNVKNFYAAIRQIDVEGKRAVAEGGWEVTKLQVGSQLVALQDGQNCFLIVTQVMGNMAQLDGSHCRFLDKLKVGQTLEPSLFDNPQSRPHREHFSVLDRNDDNRDDRLRFAVSLYYGLGNSLDSSNLNYIQGGQTNAGAGSLTMNSAPGVAVELYNTPVDGFGWSGGASYDFQRSVSGLNAYANGTFIGGAFNSPEATLTLLTLYGNVIFRSENFYFPVGLNYTIPSFVGGTNSFGNTTLVGGVGLQLAAGYIISDSFAMEIWIQNLALDGNTVTPYGTINYNGLNFTNTQLRLRFSF